MRVGVDESLLENHVDENLRNNLGQMSQIKALSMHFLYSCYREASLVGHDKNALLCVIVIDFRYSHLFVVFENFITALGILRLKSKVKFPGQSRFKLIGQPSIVKVGEDCLCDIDSQLDHRKISINILSDPSMLNLDSYDLAS